MLVIGQEYIVLVRCELPNSIVECGVMIYDLHHFQTGPNGNSGIGTLACVHLYSGFKTNIFRIFFCMQKEYIKIKEMTKKAKTSI